MTDITQQTITWIRDEMAAGRLSSRELTEAYLARIERHNHEGARLNAIREVNAKALDEARALDDARARGEIRGPLHGIPLVVKDNIFTADGMRTTVGSIAFAEFVAPRDAFLVERLRAAGAIILGKANLTEFTDVISDNMASSFSAVAGDVKNPYTKENYTRGGGSSVGPAAAVAAGFCAAAIGSETVNSIQDPCCTSSLAGIKPTVGLVSRAGIVPNCLSQDTAGPMARSVADAALILSVIAGVDFDDTATLAAAGHVADFAGGLRADALAGARVGLPRAVYFDGLDEEERAITERVVAAMREAGCEVVDPADIPTAEVVAPLRSSVLRNEFKDGLNAFLRSLGPLAPVGSLAELIAFNAADPQRRIPFGQALFEQAQAMPGTASETYHRDRLKDVLLTRQAGLDAVIDAYRLDALLVPQAAAAKMTGKAGYPAVAVPAGYRADGRPVGMTLVGWAYSERRLVQLAHALDTLLGARAAPNLDG